ncbi:hypothetical protein J6590_002844 [Homalodisca vitripennis]|nr:hypothetical protein J6590_002844 [Homalodisca vitripennis]
MLWALERRGWQLFRGYRIKCGKRHLTDTVSGWWLKGAVGDGVEGGLIVTTLSKHTAPDITISHPSRPNTPYACCEVIGKNDHEQDVTFLCTRIKMLPQD